MKNRGKRFFRFLDTKIFFFKKFFLWHQAVHITYLDVDRQVCVIKTVAYRSRTDTQTDTRTDRQKGKN